MTTQVTTTGITFNDSTVQTTAATPAYIQSQGAAVDIQTFNSTGTWTKPTGGQTMAKIQVWGAGGAGPALTDDVAGGGGGGGYSEITVPLSYLSATATATVGVNVNTGSGPGGFKGSDGGTSSFPIDGAGAPKSGTLTAEGGKGYDVYNNTIPLGGWGLTEQGGGALILTLAGDGSVTSTYRNNTIYAGGKGKTVGVSAYTSQFGGNGGQTDSGAGVQPGGGGGPRTRGGAAGRVTVTCW